MNKDFLNKEITPLNKIFNEYQFFKILFIVFMGILIGYTLQPIPPLINNLFNDSNVFKFIIIFVSGLLLFSPITVKSFINSGISAAIILIIIKFGRVLFSKYN